MAERENNTGIEKEKNSKKKIIMAIVTILLLSIAILSVAKVYNSPAKKLEKLLNLGNRYLEEMDYEQAIVAFDAAIEIDPKNADAYLGKADAYIGLGDLAIAKETLEAGYLATEGNEMIRNRLLDIYTEMAEGAIEKGLYEEGKKAYERMVELGGENAGLQEKLEELQNNRSEEGNIAEADGQEEGGLPYYELGFSPEDFTLAGYSVMDGNHAQDISEAMDKIMIENPYYTGEELPDNYTGWQWSWFGDEKSIYVEYVYKATWLLTEGAIEYSFDTEEDNIILEIGDLYDIYKEYDWPTDVLSKRPLFESKITTYISSYKDVIDILGIQEIMKKINEQEKLIEPGFVYDEELDDYIESMEEPLWEYSVLLFESQYGRTECYCIYHENGLFSSCEFSTKEWSVILRFDDDGVLCGIRAERL